MRQPLRRPSAGCAATFQARGAERQPTRPRFSPSRAIPERPGVFPTYRAARRALFYAALADLLVAAPILASLTLLVLHLIHAIP